MNTHNANTPRQSLLSRFAAIVMMASQKAAHRSLPSVFPHYSSFTAETNRVATEAISTALLEATGEIWHNQGYQLPTTAAVRSYLSGRFENGGKGILIDGIPDLMVELNEVFDVRRMVNCIVGDDVVNYANTEIQRYRQLYDEKISEVNHLTVRLKESEMLAEAHKNTSLANQKAVSDAHSVNDLAAATIDKLRADNDFLSTVRGNQQGMIRRLQNELKQTPATDPDTRKDVSRGRDDSIKSLNRQNSILSEDCIRLDSENDDLRYRLKNADQRLKQMCAIKDTQIADMERTNKHLRQVDGERLNLIDVLHKKKITANETIAKLEEALRVAGGVPTCAHWDSPDYEKPSLQEQILADRQNTADNVVAILKEFSIVPVANNVLDMVRQVCEMKNMSSAQVKALIAQDPSIRQFIATKDAKITQLAGSIALHEAGNKKSQEQVELFRNLNKDYSDKGAAKDKEIERLRGVIEKIHAEQSELGTLPPRVRSAMGFYFNNTHMASSAREQIVNYILQGDYTATGNVQREVEVVSGWVGGGKVQMVYSGSANQDSACCFPRSFCDCLQDDPIDRVKLMGHINEFADYNAARMVRVEMAVAEPSTWDRIVTTVLTTAGLGAAVALTYEGIQMLLHHYGLGF